MDGSTSKICFIADEMIGKTIEPYRTRGTSRQLKSEGAEKENRTPARSVRKKNATLLERSESDCKRKKFSVNAKLSRMGAKLVEDNEETVESDNEREDEDNDSTVCEISVKSHVQKGKVGNNVRDFDRKRQTKKNDEELSRLKEMAEGYFAVHHQKKIVTSDRTMAKLQNPRLTPKDLADCLADAAGNHEKECTRLFKRYKCFFPKWIFQLRHGFNILLHGVGSKRRLLEEFRKQMLPDLVHIVVNGFFPSLTIKNILSMITDDILKYDGSFKNIIDQSIFIKSEYNTDDADELFLIIHNIDGPMLRNSKAQNALSYLASSSKIHILASIDHINAPIIWDQSRASSYNWLWYDVTTYERYTEETSFENSLLVRQTGSLALSSLTHVLRSLTPNARGIFMLLAEYQLDNSDDQNGISLGDLYKKCREQFLVNSDLTLRAQLTEFKDHKLIKFKKGIDGVETLTIPLNSSCLKQFMEENNS